MSILYKGEHLDCFNYDLSEKPQIEAVKFVKGEMKDLSFKNNEIVCVTEGRIRFLFDDFPEYDGLKGQILFLPAGGKYHLEALNNSMVVIFRLHQSIRLCSNFNLEKLFQKNDGEDEYLPRTTGFSVLDINARLWHFLDGVNDCITDGIKCRCFFETKIKELLLLLRAYYTREELHDFFFLILSEDTAFSEYVRLRWQDYHTVNEMASSMHLTPKQFYKRFMDVFGTPPHQWFKEGRARIIYNEITSTTKQFKRIGAENGFASETHFTRFCKKELGATPTEIRAGKTTRNKM